MRHLFLSIIKPLLLSIICACSAAFSAAQTSDSTLLLNDVVVTGTRTPKLLKDAPIQTRVITAADIEKVDATNVEDLLQQEMPGVEYSYAMNQKKHMNLCGFGGQSILFLVDGERLAGETMDDVDFTRLNMANVERIEIVKGAASALYGSNAGGGVINIITKEQTEPWTLNLNARLARHNERRFGGAYGTKGKWLQNMLNVNFTSTDNFNVDNAPNPAAQVVATIYGDRTWNFKDRLVYTPTDRLKFIARAGYFYRELTRTADSPERYRDFSAGLRGLWDMSKSDNLELSYSFDQYDKSDYYKITHLDVRDYSNVQNIFRGIYNHAWNTGSILTVGTDFMHDYLMNKNLGNTTVSQNTFDAFAQYDWLIDRQWELVGAVRYDYFSDSKDAHFTPKLNVRYQPIDNLNLRLGYGMGFRSPALKEKYYNFDMVGIWIIQGNPNLKAELSHNFNASADYTKGNYNFTVAAYYNNVHNKLATGIPHYLPNDDKQLYLDYTNLKDYSVYGGEATVQARWDNGLSARFSYAYTNEQLPKDGEGHTINNQYIPARKHSLTARIDWDKQFTKNYGLRLSLNGRFLSSVKNVEFVDYYDIAKGTSTIHYPAYTLWKLSAVQRIGKAVRVTAALDNLLNYKPRYHYFNSPLTDGTNLMVGVAIDLDKIR
ncbi:MAG: TonB-dependent receptor [Bacteroidaceae bacterium]|nr:TonB-dependent receptor [Bacteroidaceae bacterium]